jgi:hypothetical protein
MNSLDEKMRKWEKAQKIYMIGIIICAILAYWPIKYRLNHPEMTETQLFIHFFDSYRE